MASETEKQIIKVAVIGAGAAGLCAAKNLLDDPEIFQFDVYEQQDDVGGTWRYNYKTGLDKYGLPIHSSMYRNLRTNLPKEVMAFPDLEFPWGNGESFIHHTKVLAYLEQYAEIYELKKHIKFLKCVENIRPLIEENSDKVEWSVCYRDVVTKEKETYIYDAVMVCNGHYSVPYTPDIPGLSDFEGILIHSHDYREPERYKNLKVVVVGAAASGIDIALELAKVATEVILVHRGKPRRCTLPSNLTQTRGIESVQQTSVTFSDGRQYTCDAVVLCTGYLYHYPFFDPNCGIKIEDQRVSPLYLHMFHIDHPTLAIWAIPKMILPFPIYHQQVLVFLKFLKGLIQLPSKEQMREETEKDYQFRLSKGMQPRHAHVMPIDMQWKYDDELSALGQIKPIPDLVRQLFREVHGDRMVSIMHYKDYNYTMWSDHYEKSKPYYGF